MWRTAARPRLERTGDRSGGGGSFWGMGGSGGMDKKKRNGAIAGKGAPAGRWAGIAGQGAGALPGGGAPTATPGDRPGAAGDLAQPLIVEPLSAGVRAGRLLHYLQLISKSVVAEGQRYTVLPIAIEGWLRTAIGAADELVEELTVPPVRARNAPAKKKAKRSAPSRAGVGARARSSRPGASRPAPRDDPYPR